MSKLSGGAIAGIVIAVVAGLALFGGGGVKLFNDKQASDQRQESIAQQYEQENDRVGWGGRKTKRRKPRKPKSKRR